MIVKRFLVKSGQAIGLTVVLIVLVEINAGFATVAALGLALVSLVALFRPMPSIGMGSRLFSTYILTIPGLFMMVAGFLIWDQKRQEFLAELRDSDPMAYLDEIEHSNPDLWFRELAEFDPDRYEEVRNRRAREFEQKWRAEKKQREERRVAACGQGNSTNAFIYTQAFVEERLKSPSTAEFPSIHAGRGVGSEPIGNCNFEVVGYVDAQNGFGATIRTHYVAQIKRLPEKDAWRLVDLTFIQN